MVSARVSQLGKIPSHYVTSGAKINSVYYCNEVLSQLLPKMGQLSNGDHILQYGASSHTSKVTLAYLEEHCCKIFETKFFGHLTALTSLLVVMLSRVR